MKPRKLDEQRSTMLEATADSHVRTCYDEVFPLLEHKLPHINVVQRRSPGGLIPLRSSGLCGHFSGAVAAQEVTGDAHLRSDQRKSRNKTSRRHQHLLTRCCRDRCCAVLPHLRCNLGACDPAAAQLDIVDSGNTAMQVATPDGEQRMPKLLCKCFCAGAMSC